MKKMDSMLKKKLLIGAAVLVLIGGGGVTYGAQKTKEGKAKETIYLTKQTTAYDKLLEEINGLFDEKAPSFLVKDVTEEQVVAIEATYEKLVASEKEEHLKYGLEDEQIRNSAKQEAKTLVTLLTETFTTQTTLNNLFESTVLNGSKVNEKIGIKKDVSAKDFDTFLSDEKTEDAFLLAVQTLAKNGQAQIKQQDKATKQVNALFDKKEVSSKVTDKAYKSAKAEVDKVLTKTVKDALNKRLATVKKTLDEKVSKEKKETATNDTNSTTVADTTNNSQTSTETATNQNSQTTDTSGGTSNNGSNNTWTGNGGSTNTGNNGGNTTGGGNGSGNGNTGGNTGGGTTGGNTGGGNTGGETTPPPTEPQKPLGGPGNSGMQFGSMAEAIAWEDSVGNDPSSQWFGMSGHIYPIYYPDGSEAFWTVNFS